MSVKCEEPIDELTVQVWLLYHHPKFKYCTLFVSRTKLPTDGLSPITRCPRRTYQALGIKMQHQHYFANNPIIINETIIGIAIRTELFLTEVCIKMICSEEFNNTLKIQYRNT